jgi:hypothetical protein
MRVGRPSETDGRLSPAESGIPPLCEAPAVRLSVGEVNHQLAAALLREWLREKFGGFSGRIVAEFSPAIVLHDPVVEAVVRHDVNDRDRHEFLFRSALKNECNVASPAVSKIVACQPLARLLHHQRVSKISVGKRNRR